MLANSCSVCRPVTSQLSSWPSRIDPRCERKMTHSTLWAKLSYTDWHSTALTTTVTSPCCCSCTTVTTSVIGFILECNYFSDWVLGGPVIVSMFTMGSDLLFMTPLCLWYSMMVWLMNCGWHVGHGVLIYNVASAAIDGGIDWLILPPKDEVACVGFDVIQEMAVYGLDQLMDIIWIKDRTWLTVWLNMGELDFSWLWRMATGVLQMDLGYKDSGLWL